MKLSNSILYDAIQEIGVLSTHPLIDDEQKSCLHVLSKRLTHAHDNDLELPDGLYEVTFNDIENSKIAIRAAQEERSKVRIADRKRRDAQAAKKAVKPKAKPKATPKPKTKAKSKKKA